MSFFSNNNHPAFHQVLSDSSPTCDDILYHIVLQDEKFYVFVNLMITLDTRWQGGENRENIKQQA